MNTTRIIEGTTLMSIGALCATAVLSLSLSITGIAPKHDIARADVIHLAPVTVIGKRLTAAEKSEMLKITKAATPTVI
jgi:hypothetical protein